MATTKLYLDIRSQKHDGTFHLKLSISKSGKSALLKLNIFITKEQWDTNKLRIVNHPHKKFYNDYVFAQKLQADTIILKLRNNPSFKMMSATQLKKHIETNLFSDTDVEPEKNNSFILHFEKYINTRQTKGTQDFYKRTLKHIKKFDKNWQNLSFEDVDKYWLISFNNYLSKSNPSQNTRNIHFRQIRAVFNDAIDEEITKFYPFRKFKIKSVATKKRSLSLENLQILFSYKPIVQERQEFLDIFKLIFYLIGINMVDLSRVQGIYNGRLEYNRAKTHKLYALKIEPEAMEIIEKYRGIKCLLNIADRYSDYRNYTNRVNKNLKKIGKCSIKDENGIIQNYPALFPQISTYWARHTWATIAAEIDIPNDTIAAALGHSNGNPVTNIYINFNEKKIDEANRAVIDYVSKNKFNNLNRLKVKEILGY